MRPWLEGLAANPSSTHGPGRAAREAVETARAEVAAALGVEPSEIVFTSGGTEADNLAVRGGARAAREADPVAHARRSSRPPSTRPSGKPRSRSARTASSPWSFPWTPAACRRQALWPRPRPERDGARVGHPREQRDGCRLRRAPRVRGGGPGPRRRRPHGRRSGGRKDPGERARARRRPPRAHRPQVRRPEGRRRPLRAEGSPASAPRRRRRAGARAARRHRERRGDRGPRRGDPARLGAPFLRGGAPHRPARPVRGRPPRPCPGRPDKRRGRHPPPDRHFGGLSRHGGRDARRGPRPRRDRGLGGLGLPRRARPPRAASSSPSASRPRKPGRRFGSRSGATSREEDVDRLLEAVPRVVARARETVRA